MNGGGKGVSPRGGASHQKDIQNPLVPGIPPRGGLPRPSPPPPSSFRSPRLVPISARSSSGGSRGGPHTPRTPGSCSSVAVPALSRGVRSPLGTPVVSPLGEIPGSARKKNKPLANYLLALHPQKSLQERNDVTESANRHIGALIPQGPYSVGDCVVHELLDENGVWQWRLGKLLWLDDTNPRVGYIIPFVPSNKNGCSPDVSKSSVVLPLLPDDRREIAVDALAALARAKEKAAARQLELAALSALLHKEEGDLSKMSRDIHKELEAVLPLLDSAKEAVGNISAVDLSEMRSYRTPPDIVMRVLEAVKIILEDAVPKAAVKWKEVAQFCKSNDFVPRVRDFDAELSKATYAHLNNAFIQDVSLSLEAATRASAAAGPLFQWIGAQIRAAEVRTRIAPLLRQHEDLTERLKVNEAKRTEVLTAQQRVFDDVRNATLAYQRAVFGFDFVTPHDRGEKHRNTDCSKSDKENEIKSCVLPNMAFLRSLEAKGLSSWEPSTVDPPTQMLMSSIMARMHVI